VRILSHGIVAALAFLVILDLGYYPWGLRAENLTRQWPASPRSAGWGRTWLRSKRETSRMDRLVRCATPGLVEAEIVSGHEEADQWKPPRKLDTGN